MQIEYDNKHEMQQMPWNQDADNNFAKFSHNITLVLHVLK